MSIRDDFLREKRGWWTAVRGSTRWPFDSALYMNEELINVIENAMQSRSGQGLKFVL